MDKPLKILFVSSEMFPFAKVGGLADVSGSLPKALVSLGHDVRVIIPMYKCVAEGGFELEKLYDNIKHPLTGRMFGFGLYQSRQAGLTTYFIQNNKFFSRNGIYGASWGEYPDNALRFSFFSKAVLAASEKADFHPDIIHCNDWQTALVPFYLRFSVPHDGFFHGTKSLFTIHNLAYQGVFGKAIMSLAGIPKKFFNMNSLEFYGKINYMKSGIIYSDIINTVSRKYASEILTPEYGCKLNGLLRSRESNLVGIPNGVDYDEWSPEKDRYLKVNYGPENLQGKAACKKDLIEYTGLSVNPERPLLGCVSRLVAQKGMDLLAGVIGDIVEMDAGIVILGDGDDYNTRLFRGLADKYPEKVCVRHEFNDELAHKIEAGCDMFVMPSRYEPCGLNQMYSIKYGTVPIVRATGGLDDVIIDNDADPNNGNGFKFREINENALLDAVKRAFSWYGDKDGWKGIMQRGMAADHSWRHSAQEYLGLYERILEKEKM